MAEIGCILWIAVDTSGTILKGNVIDWTDNLMLFYMKDNYH